MSLKKTVGALALAGALGAAASCSTGAGYYAPAAYYQTVDGVYECYYVSQMSEAYALENAGLCPTYAIPAPMPISWEEMYWDYYSSPAYYNTYIPASYRRTYVNVTCVHFHQTYSSQITKLSKTAVYKSSSGGTVRGAPKTSAFTSGTQKAVKYSVPKAPSYSNHSYGRH